MHRVLIFTAAVLAGAALMSFPAVAQTGPNPMLPAHGQRFDIWFLIDQAQEDVLELAEAVPAEKYTFRPAEGVRTFGEIYMHVAEGNFTVTNLWGKNPPAGVDPKSFVKDAANKEKVIATLKASYAYLRDEIQALSEDDMGKMITVFDHPGTIREALIFVNSHNHAHKGQSIAYARAAGIVPPWTAAMEAARAKRDKEVQEKKEKEEKEKGEQKPPAR
jgi:uncharacterized damage-inducible protein DinB